MKEMKYLAWFVATTMPLFAADTQVQTVSDNGSTATAESAASANLSPAATEVIRLASGGVGDDVVLAYIQNSQSPFNLTADDVLYLKDVGLSSTNITAMLNRDAALRNSQTATTTPQPAPTTTTETAATRTEVVENAPADVTYFYNDLLPYGTWVDLAGFGWCWQPRTAVINRSWKPYCDSGHWVYTDAGWFWQSDYSWGWAPFHYGRWSRHDRAGWVWVPDRVWAPAWVVWRTSGDNCGWAPIPPHAVFDARAGWRYNGATVAVNFDFGLRPDHFTFVPLRDFAERDLRRHQLPPTEVKNVYQRTTVINNYTINNRTVVNQGIPLQKVASATQTPIPRATVHDAPAGAQPAPGTRTTSGGQPVVYRHEVKPPTTPVRVVAQKVDDSHPTIQHPITSGPVQHVTPGGPASTTSRTQSPRGSQTTPNPTASGSRNTQPSTTTPGFGTTTRPSDQRNQPQRPSSSYTPPSSTPGTTTQPGYSTRPSDQNRQPRSGTSTQSEQNRPGQTSTTTTRPSDESKQPSRTAPSYQPPSGRESSTPPTRSSSSDSSRPSRSGSSSDQSRPGQSSTSRSSDDSRQPARTAPSSQPPSSGQSYTPPARPAPSESSRSSRPESYQSPTKVPQGGLPPRPSDSARPTQSPSSSSRPDSSPSYRPAPSGPSSGGSSQPGSPPKKNDQP